MTHPSARLRELEMRARRRFGQNFLADSDAVDRIVRAAAVTPGAPVMEIGPGLGVLTRALLAAGARLVAVELDRDLAAALREALPALHLVEGDALRVDWSLAAPLIGEPTVDGVDSAASWTVVGNLPYNVATPLLMRLLAEPRRFSRMVLMFQREVADRLEAPADGEAYGALSVQVQARARVERVLELPPGSFHPAPKIWSAVLRFSPYTAPDFGHTADGTPVTARRFDRVVRAGFSQRRKTLQNALGSLGPRELVQAALGEAGIDPSARAETIDLPGWRRLAAAFVHAGAFEIPESSPVAAPEEGP